MLKVYIKKKCRGVLIPRVNEIYTYGGETEKSPSVKGKLYFDQKFSLHELIPQKLV